MTIKHYDAFNGTGSLSLDAYWTILGGGGAAWDKAGGGFVELTGTANADDMVVHTTDGNLGLPGDHNLGTSFTVDNGIKYHGIVTMADSSMTTATRVELRWTQLPSAQQVILYIGGLAAAQVVPTNPINYAAPGTVHTLGLVCDYQAMNNGQPEYIFKGYLDGANIFTTPPRRLAWWVSTMFHVGMTGRQEAFGVPAPRLRVFEFASEIPSEAVTHEPKPTLEVDAVRTPITISDEKPDATPATFPFEIAIADVQHRRFTRGTLVDAGYNVSSPALQDGRRIMSCRWIGSATDADTLETFFDTLDNTDQNFQINIRALGIGTIDAAMLDVGRWVDVSKDIRAITFTILELK